MNREFEGFSKIFSFTFKQHIKGNVYKRTLVVILLLCFLLPAVIMPIAEVMSDDDSETVKAGSIDVSDWFVVDLTGNNTNWNFLSYLYGGSEVHICNNTESAFSEAEKYGDKSLLLIADVSSDNKYNFEVLIPDNSDFDMDDAELASMIFEYNASFIIMQANNISPNLTPELFAPVLTEDNQESYTGESGIPTEAVKEIFSAVLPYVTIMLLYFMILFYGQGVSNSVIMEKNSKLMDMFLISVKTGGMLLGKVVAITLAGVMELALWICGAIGGFAVGTAAVKFINPDTSMELIQFFDSLSLFRGMFSFTAILFAVIVLIAGFFMYCSLASIGGAIAGKPEDLSSTNVIFTMVLVVSFLLTLNFGSSDGMVSTSNWIEWFPFTAILVMPGRIILGEVGTLQTITLIGILCVTSVLIVYVAGRVYKMMSLYRGKVPRVGEVLLMMFTKK